MTEARPCPTPIETVVTYLEMTEPPATAHPPAPAAKVALMRAEAPTLSFYRYLHRVVGEPWLWWLRRAMGDDALRTIIHDPAVEVYVLHVGGVPAGFAELDLRARPSVELAYFGLAPEFVGRGFGGYLLRWAVDQAWTREPDRLRVHTCTLDHPNALSVYQKTGFVPYKRERESIDDPDLWRLFPDATERAAALQALP